jgi:Flp pilus assembly CpaF family ATPase
MRHAFDDHEGRPVLEQFGADPAGDDLAQALVDRELVKALQRRVADRLTGVRAQRLASGEPELGAGDERQVALAFIRQEVDAHVRELMAGGLEPPAAAVDARLEQAVESAIFEAGPLQVLLDDPQIENIDINGADEVWVTYADERGKVRAAPVSASDEELLDIVRTLGSYAGVNARPLTAASPQLDLRLGDGSRLSALMSASERPLVSIRRSRYPLVFLDDIPAAAYPVRARQRAAAQNGARPGQDPLAPQSLVRMGSVSGPLASFLRAAVLGRCNIVVAGATDAGKTTLLRAMINCVPASERLVTVERALELGVGRYPGLHPDVAELEEVLPDPHGTGGLSIGDLVLRSRRMNPSRVIVGEVMGPEVMQMLDAMSQGNDGSLSTIHAREGAQVFTRLAMYAKQHQGTDHATTYDLAGSCIDFVVFVRKNPLMGGQRSVMEVLEVTGSADGHVTRSRIFGPGRDGRAQRDPEVAIMRAGLLSRHGYHDTDDIDSLGGIDGMDGIDYPGAGGWPARPVPLLDQAGFRAGFGDPPDGFGGRSLGEPWPSARPEDYYRRG